MPKKKSQEVRIEEKENEEQRRISKEARRIMAKIIEASVTQRLNSKGSCMRSHIKNRKIHRHRHKKQLSFRVKVYARQAAVSIIKARIKKEQNLS